MSSIYSPWDTAGSAGADLTGTMTADRASGPSIADVLSPQAPTTPDPVAALGQYQAASVAKQQEQMPGLLNYSINAKTGTVKAEMTQGALAELMGQLTDLKTMKTAAMAHVAQLKQQESSGSPIIDALSQFAGNMAANDPTMPGFVRALGATSLAMGPQGIRAQREAEEQRAAQLAQASAGIAEKVYSAQQKTEAQRLQLEQTEAKQVDARVKSAMQASRMTAKAAGGPMNPEEFQGLMEAFNVPSDRIADAYRAHVGEANAAVAGKEGELTRKNQSAVFRDELKRNYENEVGQPHKLEAIRESFTRALLNATSPRKMDFDETLYEHKKAIENDMAQRKETAVLGPQTQHTLTQASATNQYIGTVEGMLSQPEFAQVQGPLFQFTPSKKPGEIGEFKLNPQAVLPKQFQNLDKTTVDSMIAHEIPRLLGLLLNGQAGGASILRQQVGKKLVEDMGITGGVRADQALAILKIVRDTNNSNIAAQMRMKRGADWNGMKDLIGAEDPANAYFFKGKKDVFGKPIVPIPDPFTPSARATQPKSSKPDEFKMATPKKTMTLDEMAKLLRGE